jgi:hypothetical protein
VVNNFISNVAAYGNSSTSGNNGYGITLTGFNSSGFKIYNNTIALTTNQGLATGNPACLLIGSGITAPGAVDIRNNIFANYMTVGTNRYAIICNAPATALANMDYNDYFVTSGSNLGFMGSNRADLVAWRTATGQDVNSIQANPGIVSPTNLHINTGWNTVDGKGTYLASVPTDIDGDTRNNPSDIGADEYTYVLPVDPAAFAA